MQEPFEIGGITIQPGERKTIDLHVARLYTHAELNLPVQVIHGKKAGPRLFVSACVHGDEINGMEIIRRLLQMKTVSRINGTLIVAPIINVYGLIMQSRYLPDRRDLNRSFPGLEKGSLTARLAHTFTNEILAKCTHGIDLHTGSNHRTNLPQIRAKLSDPETVRLAKAFGAPVILNAGLRDGSLRESGMAKNVPVLLYEAGEALRFNEFAVRTGLRGVRSVMRTIGMISISRKRKSILPVISHKSSWLRAPKSGVLTLKTRLGEFVKKGDFLGSLSDPFGESVEDIVATDAGMVIGLLKLPLVYRGDAVLHIAHFDKDTPVAETIEAFEEHLELSEFSENLYG